MALYWLKTVLSLRRTRRIAEEEVLLWVRMRDKLITSTVNSKLAKMRRFQTPHHHATHPAPLLHTHTHTHVISSLPRLVSVNTQRYRFSHSQNSKAATELGLPSLISLRFLWTLSQQWIWSVQSSSVAAIGFHCYSLRKSVSQPKINQTFTHWLMLVEVLLYVHRNRRFIDTGAQDVHLDFHTTLEHRLTLWWCLYGNFKKLCSWYFLLFVCLLFLCVGFVIFDVIFRKKNMEGSISFSLLGCCGYIYFYSTGLATFRFAFFAPGVFVVVAAVDDVFTDLWVLSWHTNAKTMTDRYMEPGGEAKSSYISDRDRKNSANVCTEN